MKKLYLPIVVLLMAVGLSACSADSMFGPDQEYINLAGDGTNQGVSRN